MTIFEFDTEVADIIQRSPNVKSFRFKVKKDVSFKPGQYLLVTIKVKDEERTKPFSFSNSPTEKGYVEFTKRLTGSPFSNALEKLKVGDRVRLKLPYGNFTFGGEYKKIAFLSGGVGITPLRSITKYIADTKLSTDLVLLYGNSTKEDIIFRQDLDRMKSANKNIKVVYTLTAPDKDKEWKGRIGYIDDKMIKEEIPDFKERVFYVCGPPKMVESLADILKNRLNVQDDRIKLENFIGY